MFNRFRVNIGIGISIAAVGLYGYSCVGRVPYTDRLQITGFPRCFDSVIGKVERFRYEQGGNLLEGKVKSFKRVQAILDRLEGTNEKERKSFHLNLVDSKTKNFLSYPGGGITVFNQFIESEPMYKNDSILAYQLAHEMGHIRARHQSEMGARIYAIDLAISCAAFTAVSRRSCWFGLGVAALMVGKVFEIQTRYIPKQRMELEADYIAMRIMAEAGYDPSFAVQCMGIQCNTLDPIPLYSSHPPCEERLRYMEEHLPAAMLLYEGKHES